MADVMSKTQWLELRERGAVALYKLDHPTYSRDDFSHVAFLSTVLTYRERAEVVMRATEMPEPAD